MSHELQHVQTEFKTCVQTYYCKCIVSFLGHCFRHRTHPVTKLLSLPLAGRLDSLRQQRPRDPSGSAQVARQFLTSLGVQLRELVAGRPCVRGHSGYVFRWGEGWFHEIRDGGSGWDFQKDDKPAVNFRVDLLLDIYRHRRGAGLLPLLNLMQDAISDVQGEAPI